MNSHTDEEKQNIINCYKSGESVTSISDRTGISESAIYSWIKDSQSKNKQKPVTRATVVGLERTITRLENMIEVLQRAFDVENVPTKERLQLLEELYGEYSVHNLCDALLVPRGTFYNHIKRNKRSMAWYAIRREKLKDDIQQVYDDYNQIYGANKIAAVLQTRGDKVSVRVVRELMQDMGLISIREGAKDYYDKEKRKYKNYLNQQFDVTRPNEVWVGDVTCYRFNKKNYFICVVLDLYARKVVGYKVGKNNSTQLTKSTFKIAYEARQPNDALIFHSDNGSPYVSRTFCDYLRSLNVTQSFSRKHIPYDNSVMESFFSNMKREELYRYKYRSEKEFKAAIDKYMVFYNTERPHAKNKYKSPDQKEADFFNKQAKISDI